MKIYKKFITIASILTLLCALTLPIAAHQASAESANLIANPSAEIADPSNTSSPQAWSQGSWGTNTHSFSYTATGHSGAKSLQVQISSYTSGDAKWFFTPVNVTGGTQYTFSDYYQSNIASDVVVEINDGNGNYTYQDLGPAAAAASWQQYSANFTVPASAKSATVFHLINTVGTLSIDDASLTSGQASTPPSDPTTPPSTPAPTGTNLVANASFETANGAAPQGWSKDAWGTNSSTFTYATSGHTGSRSGQVKIKSYSSGDVKWAFTPVAVTSGAQYAYSDYYQSTISSEIVAQFDDGNGNYTYQDLGTAAKASAWQQYSVNFSVPTGVKNVTIFHLIGSVGTLSIDDVSLIQQSAGTGDGGSTGGGSTGGGTTSAANLVPNASVETPGTTTPGTPQSWYTGQWGNNTAAFNYNTTSGHTGNHSVGITMSNFTDGGANWTYDKQPVQAGQVYEFSNYYQSNVATQVLVAVQMNDSTTQYVWLGNPYTSDGAWTHFYRTFTMPAGAVSAIAYQTISANGYFTADDFTLQPYVPAGFNSPMVSLTFDDGIASQYTNALPVLKQYGLKGTFYVISGDIGVCDPNVSSICYMTKAQVKGLQTAGQEVGSHTVDHPYLTTLTQAQVKSELADSQTALAKIVSTPVTDFAAPYGDVNLSVLTQSQQYYTSQRGVEAGYNDKNNYNQQDLLVQDVDSDTTVAQVESYIDYAKATNTWLILVYHDINKDTTIDPGYDTTPADFKTEMAYLKASGVAVQPMNTALQTIAPQVSK